MKIRKRKHYCKSRDEIINILNSQYNELHVRNIDWYLENQNYEGKVLVPCIFIPEMKCFLGETFSSFKAVRRPNYIRIEPIPDNGRSWSLEMFKEFDEFVIREE